MEDSQGDRRLADSTGTHESDGREVVGQADNLLNQLVTSETGPRRWGWRFAKYSRIKYKMMDPFVVQIPDLV